ncbi:MAG: YihY/virulence factor BrkB family protein [Bacteriovoracaceae bacterium]
MTIKIKKRINYKGMLQEIGHKLWHGFQNYRKNHGSLIAASSTFYAILSSLPIVLTLVSILGVLLGDYRWAQGEVFFYMKLLFPNLSPWFFSTVKNVVLANSHLKVNWFNWIVLVWAATGFINSIFHGIHILSGHQFHKTLFIPVKSFLVLIVTVAAVVFMIFVDSNIFHWMVILLYFTFMFYFIMGRTISMKDAFLGAFTFVILFFLSKFLFWLYLKYLKTNLIRNFGDFYSMIVAVLWVYFVMISFFMSASVAFIRPKLEKK